MTCTIDQKNNNDWITSTVKAKEKKKKRKKARPNLPRGEEVRKVLQLWRRQAHVGFGWINDFDDLVAEYAPNYKQLQIMLGHTANILCVRFSPDSKYLVSSSEDKTIQLWEIAKAKLIRTFRGHLASVHLVTFSPSGDTIASAASDASIRIWKTKSRKAIKQIKSGPKVTDIHFSQDGRFIVASSKDGKIRAWTVTSGHGRELFCIGQNPIDKFEFSPDGNYMFCISYKTIHVFNVMSCEEIFKFEKQRFSAQVATFIPGGLLIESYSDNRYITKWDIKKKNYITNPSAMGYI
ncbi:WD-40 repeat-containing tyrosine protein kinase [Reticulomyxa filosa]|uniref:WD-40 repeat-containing tyrosine protein kinase n=1 Tax=Reticulomyxa filosa TaxID=46433 RepID=X6NLS4_RETFI|nr:WD-40 repeat-containing tyrosine protein kinase [Reticulomyxa filosa]|eukprot:ETO26853.1 WD-40 repeat-containing tyrosine protein kinase [Reticulomyxa filosa]